MDVSGKAEIKGERNKTLKKIRFGIISTGDITHAFIRACSEVEGVEVVAIASRDSAKAERMQKEYGIERAYGSYRELYNDGGVDAVYIATPHNIHKQNCLDAIRAGKHVLCEKSLTLNKEDSLEIFEAAEEKDIFVMEAVWTRFLPTTAKAREWVEEGRIGRIVYMDASSTFLTNENDRGGRLLRKDTAGGALYELGIYDFYMTQYFNRSEIIECQTITKTLDSGVDGFDLISLKLADGTLLSFRCSITCRTENYICLYGEKGFILMTPQAYCPEKVRLFSREGLDNSQPAVLLEEFGMPIENGLKYEIEHFKNVLEEGGRDSDIIPHADTLKCGEFYALLRQKWNNV